jgi:hypothetical protein
MQDVQLLIAQKTFFAKVLMKMLEVRFGGLRLEVPIENLLTNTPIGFPEWQTFLN